MATTITVTGTYIESDGTTPAQGVVTAHLSTPLIDASGNRITTPVEHTARLNENGAISLSLVATNDPGTTPAGATWLFTERIHGALVRTFSAEIPYDAEGGTIDLADIAPVQDSTITYGLVTSPSTGQNRIQPASAAVVPLTIKGAASQTADLLSIQDNAGTELVDITAAGSLRVAGVAVETTTGAEVKVDTHAADTTAVHGITDTAQLTTLNTDQTITAQKVIQPSTDKIALIVKAMAGQTADLQQWQNSSGTALVRVTKEGRVWVGDVQADATNPTLAVRQEATGSAILALQRSDGTTLLSARETGAFELIAPASTTGAPSRSSPNLRLYSSRWDGSQSQNERVELTNTRLDSGSGRTALMFRDVDNLVPFAIAGRGKQVSVGYDFPSEANLASRGQFHVLANAATTPGATIRGAASQTADLQQWQNSIGTVLSRIDSSGRMVLPTISGSPTGTPTNGTMVVDTTGNKLWIYSGGWKSTTLA